MSAAMMQPGAPSQAPPTNPWEPVAQTPIEPPQAPSAPDVHAHASLALGAAHHAAGSAQAAVGAVEQMKQMMATLDTQAQAVVMAISAASSLADEVRQLISSSQEQHAIVAALQETAVAMRDMTQGVTTVIQGITEAMHAALAELKAPRRVTVERDKDGALTGAVSEVANG